MKFDHKINTLWLDLDGVFADFDAAALQLFGMDGREFEDKYGSDEFWKTIGQQDHFFYNLKVITGSLALYAYVSKFNPVVLSGSPVPLGETARVDKFRWIEKTFGKYQRSVICQSKNKAFYCKPGDIIIDDWPKHMTKWEEAGGTWIMHKNADDTISQLGQLGFFSDNIS